jgi:tRNA (cytidine32/uridine32-2'-O)-methyltransferase
MSPRERVRIVLVETTHPGNIGAVARAMKTMALERLVLVRPKVFPAPEAVARASGADDLLERAVVCDTLADAVADCAYCFAATARSRHIAWPVRTPHELAADFAAEAFGSGDIALVFGRESSGLSNEDLDQCCGAIRIPTQPGFSSLNLAMAVQIVAYEVYQATAVLPVVPGADFDPFDALATAAEIDLLHQHLLRVATAIDYFDPAKPRLLPRRLRRLLARGGLLRSETQILRGLLTAVERWRKPAGG